MVLCLSSSIRRGINLLFFSLKVLKYPLISGNIKSSGLITLCENPIKYLELFFVSINFEITILSVLTSYIFIFIYLFICLFIYLFIYFAS